MIKKEDNRITPLTEKKKTDTINKLKNKPNTPRRKKQMPVEKIIESPEQTQQRPVPGIKENENQKEYNLTENKNNDALKKLEEKVTEINKIDLESLRIKINTLK